MNILEDVKKTGSQKSIENFYSQFFLCLKVKTMKKNESKIFYDKIHFFNTFSNFFIEDITFCKIKKLVFLS